MPPPPKAPALSDRAKAASEVATRLKRCLSIYRLYKNTHEMSVSALDELFDNTTKHTAKQGAIRFEVEAHRLLSEGEPVLEDDGRDESIIMRLYSEGVLAITFNAGVPREELARYLEFWWQALSGSFSGEHSFATMVWEEEFRSITTEFRERLDFNDGDKSKRAETRQAILDGMNSPAARASAGGADLEALFGLCGLSGLGPGAARAGLPKEGMELAEVDRAALLTGITAGLRGVPQRVLFGVWKSYPYVLDKQAAPILGFLERVYSSMLESGDLTELEKGLSRVVEGDNKNPYLPEFLEGLCQEQPVGRLTELLGDRVMGDRAKAVLKTLPDMVVDRLVPKLGKLGPSERRGVLDVLKSKKIPSEVLAGYMVDLGSELTQQLFELAAAYSPEHSDVLIRAGSVHPDPLVRAKAVSSIRAEKLAEYRVLLLGAAADPDERVREAAIATFVRVKSPEAVDMLEMQLRNPDSTAQVKIQALRSLVQTGSDRARSLLEGVLRDSTENREVRSSAATGLATFESARALLRKEADAWFGDRFVRDACREALRRLDATAQKAGGAEK